MKRNFWDSMPHFLHNVDVFLDVVKITIVMGFKILGKISQIDAYIY